MGEDKCGGGGVAGERSGFVDEKGAVGRRGRRGRE